MTNRWIWLTLLAAAAAVFVTWWTISRSLNPSEATLFDALNTSIGSSGPSPVGIARAFDLPSNCGKDSCFFEAGKIGEMTYAKGDLRPGNDGLVFVLEELGGECIRADRVSKRVGTGAPKQSCDDAICWYVEAQHPWGIVAFELEEPSATCVSSVVINTLPEHRAPAS